MASNTSQELIVSKQVLSISQTFSTGPAMGRFLQELRDNKRIMALRCQGNGRFLLPPREVDAWSLEEPHEWVEVGPGGLLREYDIIYYASPDPLTGETRDVPYCVGWIHMDGADKLNPLWHLIDTSDLTKIRSGARVRAVFREERKGEMEDIVHFEVID